MSTNKSPCNSHVEIALRGFDPAFKVECFYNPGGPFPGGPFSGGPFAGGPFSGEPLMVDHFLVGH